MSAPVRALLGLTTLLLTAAGAAWLALASAEGGGDAPSPEPAAETAAGVRAEVEPRVTEPVADVFHDAAGDPLPAGTRRQGARRVVTPDGRVFVRARGDNAWVPMVVEQAPPAVDPALERLRRISALPPRQREKALQFLRQTEAQRQEAESAGRAADLRPATLPGDLANTAPAKWGPVSKRFETDGTSRPRLGVTRHPEGATRRRDRSAAEEIEEVELVTQHGLRADYYDFLQGRLRTIPDLATLPPTLTRIDMAVDFENDAAFALPFLPDTFAVLWRGYLHVPEGGSYTFTLGSDDGVRLAIGGAVVVEHLGLRSHAESAGVVELAAGRQPFELAFYENEGYASCRLFWAGPSWKRKAVAPRHFSPPDEVAEVVQPHVVRVHPAAANVNEVVALHGIGFSESAPLNRVTFHGVEAEVIEAAPDRLRVRVPIGASTGDVVVQVGPLSSLPRGFEVTSLSGLFAEYFHVGADLHTMPALDEMAPFFVRLEGPLDFHQDTLWKLPYDPDVFAARYTGLLYFPQDDDYRITLGSDDGAHMSIDGAPLLAAPGLHSYREVAQAAHFTQGFHPVEITFFENRGVARLRLFWERPGDVERTVIPRGFLFPPAELVDRPTPQLTGVTPAAAEIGATVTLSGTDFGEDLRHVRVHFPGEVWARPTRLRGESLEVRVPYGAASGALRVEVGVRRSNAAPFRVSSVQGLTADYYVFSSADDLRKHATPKGLADRTPNLTRVETSLQRETAADWKLPFPAQNFAVHLHGTLGVEYPTRRTLLLQAEGGAFLHVDDRRRVDCGPFHPLRESGGAVDLSPGAHAFDLYYFHTDGEPQLRVLWTPWGHHDHIEVPIRWFLAETE